MCGRYGFDGSDRALEGDFPGLRILDPPVRGYNLSPGRSLSIVRREPEGLVLRNLIWGLRTERIPKPLVNVRAEGLSHHRLFGPLFAHQRCVIPATIFFEWLDDSTPRQPFAAKPKLDRFGLAGIWLDSTFAILTTRSIGRLAEIHGRMPVVLPVESQAAWLDPELTEGEELRKQAKPLPVTGLEVYPVGTELNDARKEGPSLIAPVQAERPQVRAPARARRNR